MSRKREQAMHSEHGSIVLVKVPKLVSVLKANQSKLIHMLRGCPYSGYFGCYVREI